MDTIKAQQWLIGIFSVLLIVILIIVAGVEMKKSRSYKPEIEIDKMTKKCITCHEKKGIAVKQIDAWKESRHAVMGIGCYECHEAKKGDFDAFTCSDSDILVARHPTPKDCARCHKKEVAEFSESKHAHQFWLLKNADRAVFENPISTRHGCEQCHQIGNLWLKRYKNKDYYLGLKFKADSTWNYYKERNDYDFKKMKEQVIDLTLPGKPFYKK